jgi:hypothetical protein
MRTISLTFGAILVSATAALSQQYGNWAYPDYWQGGAPLPPLGATAYAQPQGYYVTAPQGYVTQPQVTYVQPQMTYVHPQAVHVAPPPVVVQPQRYVTRTVTGTYSYQVVVPELSGPPQSRCIVSTLNGTQWTDGCAFKVTINPADVPHLRQKFQNYRPNSGYALNLPTDSDYR